MTTQRAISAKIDYSVFEKLEKEAYATATPKNRVINQAIANYVALRDQRRRLFCSADADYLLRELEKYLRLSGFGHQVDLVKRKNPRAFAPSAADPNGSTPSTRR